MAVRAASGSGSKWSTFAAMTASKQSDLSRSSRSSCRTSTLSSPFLAAQPGPDGVKGGAGMLDQKAVIVELTEGAGDHGVPLPARRQVSAGADWRSRSADGSAGGPCCSKPSMMPRFQRNETPAGSSRWRLRVVMDA